MPTFKANNLTINYTDEGQGDALLLIHGFPLSSDMYQPQRDALKHRFRVLTPDLRGMGTSDVPTSGYSMDAYVDDLLALLDYLEIEQAVVGGMSMGGYITFALVRRAPHRVKGLILIDTKANADNDEMLAKRRSLIEQVRSDGAIAVAATDTLFTPKTHEQNPTLIKFTQQMMLHVPADGIIGALQAMIDRPDSTSTLSQIRVPTLIIVGSDDPLTPPESAQTMQQAIAGSQLVVIEGASHAANLERPAEVNKAILDWAGQNLG